MDRNIATKSLRDLMNSHGLNDWSIRISATLPGMGMCSERDKTIFINAHHIDTHPEPEIIDTFKHEITHALVGCKNGHNATWVTKALAIGVNNLTHCSTIGLSPHIIDAIRSGATVEVTFAEETIERQITVEEKVFKPKYNITRLQERCPECNAVAKEKFHITTIDKEGNDCKLITLECFHIIKKILPRATPFTSMVSNDWQPHIKSCKHEWPSKEDSKRTGYPKNRCLKCGEFKLFPFQVAGAQLAESGLSMRKGFGIFDDMGLGKTVQALAVVKYHPEYTPTLYVTKSSIKFQWFKQIIRWLGPEYLAQIIATSKDFVYPGLKSYVIPYDLLRRFPREKLQKLGLKLVILDECQQIKNVDSTRTQEVRRLVGDPNIKVLPLSATPWKNRGDEFFPVLNMMDPIKFYSQQAYLDRWVEYYYQGDKKKMGGIRNPAKFREYTESILVRREYNEVMDEFPEINRMKLNLQLDDLSQSTYDDEVSDFVKWYNEYVISGEEDSIDGMEILAKLARMRHITGLAKIPATLGFLEQFSQDTDKKIVVFVHHQDVGALMYNALIGRDKETNPEWYDLAQSLKDKNIKVFKYTSDLSDEARFAMQEEFNKTPRAFMVASTLACGEGVDLQTCADTIMHERQWNPQNEEQAAPGRFRRIGQEAKVINITVPEAEGTVDEHFDTVVEGKRVRFHAVMNKGEAPQWNESDLAKELAQLIVAKHKEKNKGKPTRAEMRVSV